MDPSTTTKRGGHRPKRSSSQNVNYSLKVRKIIQPFDNRATRSLLTTPTSSNSSSSSSSSSSSTSVDSNTLPSSPAVFKRDSKGRIIGVNNSTPSPNDDNGTHCSVNKPTDTDVVSLSTGLPLSSGPTEKIRREALWNYKKVSSGSTGLLVPSLCSGGGGREGEEEEGEGKMERHSEVFRGKKFNSDLELQDRLRLDKAVIKPSWIRYTRKTMDSLASTSPTTASTTTAAATTDLSPGHSSFEISSSNTPHHIKIKLTELRNSKLFGQNSTVNSNSNNSSSNSNSNSKTYKTRGSPQKSNSPPEIENEDFCSACLQTGMFICCDTCPRSFHFLCLDPPIDPNHLPEGDWSCPKCTFQQNYPSISRRNRAESAFLKDLQQTYGSKIFGKLIFDLQDRNPRQFELPVSIKNTFDGVKTGLERGQYSDDNDKVPLSYRQLYEYPYGQSPTQLDRYAPESHFDTTLNDEGSCYDTDSQSQSQSGNNPGGGTQVRDDRFLICYKCNMTRMGTWDHPEDSRVIIRCDYCGTPWHLDCVPDFPRASLKNLGRKWKCPLHSSVSQGVGKRRRLNQRLQKYYEPLQLCNFKNDGDVEIKLVEEQVNDVEARGSEAVLQNYKDELFGDSLNPIPLLSETAVKLDFCNKILNYKRIERIHEYKLQMALLDKLLRAGSMDFESIRTLLYFKVANSEGFGSLRKRWDFKELCLAAEDALASVETSKSGEESGLTGEELKQLLVIKRLIESKPKEDVIKFFGLDKA